MPNRTFANPANRIAIGVKNESSLHNDLKRRYAGEGGGVEVPVANAVADGITATGEYIEVQTGNFAALQKKVAHITALGGKIRIIHPIAVNKRLETYDSRGTLIANRKSPKHGTVLNVFDALVHAPDLLVTRGVTLEIVMVDIAERRIKDGKGAWRRHGVSIGDKSLVLIRENHILLKPADWLRFLPFAKDEEFTVSSLAERLGAKKTLASKAVYVFSKTGIVKRTGKRGNAHVYAAQAECGEYPFSGK